MKFCQKIISNINLNSLINEKEFFFALKGMLKAFFCDLYIEIVFAELVGNVFEFFSVVNAQLSF